MYPFQSFSSLIILKLTFTHVSHAALGHNLSSVYYIIHWYFYRTDVIYDFKKDKSMGGKEADAANKQHLRSCL